MGSVSGAAADGRKNKALGLGIGRILLSPSQVLGSGQYWKGEGGGLWSLFCTHPWSVLAQLPAGIAAGIGSETAPLGCVGSHLWG